MVAVVVAHGKPGPLGFAMKATRSTRCRRTGAASDSSREIRMEPPRPVRLEKKKTRGATRAGVQSSLSKPDPQAGGDRRRPHSFRLHPPGADRAHAFGFPFGGARPLVLFSGPSRCSRPRGNEFYQAAQPDDRRRHRRTSRRSPCRCSVPCRPWAEPRLSSLVRSEAGSCGLYVIRAPLVCILTLSPWRLLRATVFPQANAVG